MKSTLANPLARRGISLMEVLFSIGIVTVGLLGVITLLPLASRYVGKGTTADGVSAMGRNARHEFFSRGMSSPFAWRVDTGALSGAPLLGLDLYADPAICIDPRFVATNRLDVGPIVAPAANPLTKFPHYNSGGSIPSYPYMVAPAVPSGLATEARMARVTVTTNGLDMMSLWQADRVCVTLDDLVVTRPTDQTLPPDQLFNWHPGPDGQWGIAGVDDNNNGIVDDGGEAGAAGSDDIWSQRQSQGSLSWMATLAPQLDVSLSLFNQAHSGGLSRAYTLTIVVFENRPRGIRNWNDGAVTYTLSGPVFVDPTAPPPNSSSDEVLLNVAQFYGAGLANGFMLSPNGGSLELQTISGNANDLKIRDGDWLMLSSFIHTSTAVGLKSSTFKWYRILKTESESRPDGTGQFRRNITLDGPDWVFSPGEIVQATFVPGVAGIYEKTILLEFPSNWNP